MPAYDPTADILVKSKKWAYGDDVGLVSPTNIGLALVSWTGWLSPKKGIPLQELR
jgi:hypothetical protein